MPILKKYIIETEPIRFEGNNYSHKWTEEAEKRGLPNVKRTGHALDALVAEKNTALLKGQGIFASNAEIHSRYNTKLEQYITALEIEAGTFCDLIKTRVLPAAIVYQQQLIDAVRGMKDLGSFISDTGLDYEKDLLEKISEKIAALYTGCQKINSTVKKAEEITDLPEKAKYFSDAIVDLLNEARKPADELEQIIPDDLWPLPKYSEMLFVM